MPELIVILVLALIILGPKKLPDLAKSLGKGLAEFRKATNELKESINVDEDLSEMKRNVSDAVSEVRKIENLASQELREWEKAAIEQERKEIERKLAKDDTPAGEPAPAGENNAAADSEALPHPYKADGEEETSSSSGDSSKTNAPSAAEAEESKSAELDLPDAPDDIGSISSHAEDPSLKEDTRFPVDPDTEPPAPPEDSHK